MMGFLQSSQIWAQQHILLPGVTPSPPHHPNDSLQPWDQSNLVTPGRSDAQPQSCPKAIYSAPTLAHPLPPGIVVLPAWIDKEAPSLMIGLKHDRTLNCVAAAWLAYGHPLSTYSHTTLLPSSATSQVPSHRLY